MYTKQWVYKQQHKHNHQHHNQHNHKHHNKLHNRKQHPVLDESVHSVVDHFGIDLDEIED